MKKTSIHLYKLSLLLIVGIIFSCGSKDVQQIPTSKVVKGVFHIDMYEEGEIEAVNSVTLTSPNTSWRYGGLKITEIIKDGEEVKANDTVIRFDPSEVQKAIVEAESRLEISKAELEKMEAQHSSDLEELKADYEVTNISQEISKIRFESAIYESDIKKKEIELNLKKADIALVSAKDQINNRIKIQKEETKQKRLSIERDNARLAEAFETLKKLSVVTPSPGIAIIGHNWSSGNKYQSGDQCWAGSPLISLPDLSALKATVKINEVDIAKLTKGLKVEIKPDAFSEKVFTGRIEKIANLATNKDNNSKVKVFPTEIVLNETDKNLLPGLTVSCRIIIDEIENMMYVPIESIFAEGDKEFVYKKTKIGKYDKVEVETGLSNSDYIIIKEGIKEGDEVALINPFGEKEKQDDTKEE